MLRTVWGLAGALLLVSGCGTASSPSYGTPLDVPGADAVVVEDVPEIPDSAQPRVDVRTDASVGLGAPYPIILHHGFAGFRDIGPLNYFYNVAADLRARGEYVHEAEVAPFQPANDRAYALARIVDRVLAETGRSRVIIIGHSQGGLDARQMISTLGYGDRVALLATVSTPHRGTHIADAVLGNVPDVADALIDGVATLIGYAINDVRERAELRRTLEGLSETEMLAFNRQNPDDSRVVYWSWAGRSNRRAGVEQCTGARVANVPSQLDSTNAILLPFATFLEQNDPVAHVNDGMVEVQSARWGIFMGCIPGDHFDEVGQIAHSGTQPSGFNHIEFYRDIVQRVRDAGY